MFARIRVVSLWLLVALLPLQWIVLARPFGIPLKPAHITLPIIVAAVLSLPGRTATLARFARSHKIFVAIVYLYIMLTLSSAFWASDPAIPVREAFKLLTHFVVFVATAIVVSSLHRRQLVHIITTAVPIGLGIFLVLAMLAFTSAGGNLFTAYLTAVSYGDARQLQFGFYPIIFGGDTSTSLRNTLVGTFVIYAVLMLGVRTTHQAARWFSVAVAVPLILLSVSRSNILALIIACTGAAGLSAASKDPGIGRNRLAFLALLGVAASVLLLFGGEYLAGMTTALFDRFASVDLDSNQRVAMYEVALDQIAAQPFFGYGAGHEVALGDFSAGRTWRVHNLFMASWLELGVGGLALSVALYGYIVSLCMARARSVRTLSTTAIGLAPAWLIVLPVLPLIRSMLSGDGGQFTFIEWFALSLFFGLLQSKTFGNGAPREPVETGNRFVSFAGSRRSLAHSGQAADVEGPPSIGPGTEPSPTG